ncbi:MAG: hypothetical protein RPU40_10900 [Candidatus Sedimenticola sp. (ex Thyasira tokunagai)]
MKLYISGLSIMVLIVTYLPLVVYLLVRFLRNNDPSKFSKAERKGEARKGDAQEKGTHLFLEDNGDCYAKKGESFGTKLPTPHSAERA